jgi:hypothetical protein
MSFFFRKCFSFLLFLFFLLFPHSRSLALTSRSLTLPHTTCPSLSLSHSLTLLLSASLTLSLSVPSTYMRTITRSRLHVRVHVRVPAIGVHG